jgi:hypothetical protein
MADNTSRLTAGDGEVKSRDERMIISLGQAAVFSAGLRR